MTDGLRTLLFLLGAILALVFSSIAPGWSNSGGPVAFTKFTPVTALRFSAWAT